MTTIRGDKITAVDLSQVVMVNSYGSEETPKLSAQDIAWQEARRNRKVRKLDFDVR